MDELLTAATAGLAGGGAYALLGVCTVFTYRLVAVVNFTGAAVGAAGAFIFVALTEAGFPLAPSLVVGLLFGAALGGAIGFVMTRWFASASASTKAAVTVALLAGIAAIGLRLSGGQHIHAFPDVVPGSAFRLAGVEVTWAAVATLGLALLFTIAADQFLMRSRAGLHLRALSERPVAAELIGIPVRRLSLLVWGVTGAAATLALMIVAPQRSPDFLSLSLLVVPALAAALIGFFNSFWAALIGGTALGVVESLTAAFPSLHAYRAAVPFLVILAVLLWSQRGARWDEAR